MKVPKSFVASEKNHSAIAGDKKNSCTQCKGYKARTNYPQFATQLKGYKTGLPGDLKSGIENMSGMAMDDVKVHYNSSKPSQLEALAYTKGNDIHVGPGQEKFLAHEAWHVVQQRQGRVKPNLQSMGESINDSPVLEKEADTMGSKARHFRSVNIQAAEKTSHEETAAKTNIATSGSDPVQKVGEHLQTGLKKDAAVERFAGNLKKAMKNKGWATKATQARATELVKHANTELAKAGVPKLKGAVISLTAAQPTFRFASWDMELVGDMSRNDSAYQEWMADATYHEARHAEQWFRMCRLLAGKGKTAAEIVTEIGVQADIAAAAVKKPLKARSKAEQKKNSKKSNETHNQMVTEGDDWYQSVYGTGTAHRTGVLTANPMDNAAYMALPEEVDAYIVGPKAAAKFKALMAKK